MTSSTDCDRGLHDREFVAAESRDETVGADAEAQARGDRFQQFVADQVTERIVDALEFVDVDVVHGKVLIRRNACEFVLQPLAKQSAVGQIGQGVVVGEVGDPLLGAPAFGDVLMGRDPSAVRQRFVDDLHCAPVGGLDDVDFLSPDVAQDGSDVLALIAGEGAGRLAMGNDLAEAAARFHNVLGEPVHFDVAMVADDEPLRRIEQQQSLRHVVDGAVEAQFLKRQPQLRTGDVPATAGAPPETAWRAITSTEAAPAPIRKFICSRQSASAADTVVVAMITIGKLTSLCEAISRSWPSIELIRRVVNWFSSNTFCWFAVPVLRFRPIMSST